MKKNKVNIALELSLNFREKFHFTKGCKMVKNKCMHLVKVEYSEKWIINTKYLTSPGENCFRSES